jgi:hypothetical protein
MRKAGMPSPTRIFKGLTVEQLNELKTKALARISSGDFTSLSGGAKSSSRKFEMTPQEILEEVKVELAVLNGTPRVTHTTQDFSRLRVNNTTVTE